MDKEKKENGTGNHSKRNKDLENALDGGLYNAVQDSGGLLTGFSMKIEPCSTLMTIRAVHNDTPMILFVGGKDLPDVLLKALSDIKNDRSRWRTDNYTKMQT